MKRFSKAAAEASGLLTVLVASYLLLLAYPEPLFCCSATFASITFSAHAPLPPEVAGLASEIQKRLAGSELFDPRGKQRVFIVDRPWLWTLLNGPYRQAVARNVELSDAIFVPRLDIAAGEIVHFDGRRASAVNVLTHEAVHTLVRRRIGRLRLWRLQWWQKEGYAEYIASVAAGGSQAPARYRDAALAWKYLLEQRRLSFDQILTLNDSLSDVLGRRQ